MVIFWDLIYLLLCIKCNFKDFNHLYEKKTYSEIIINNLKIEKEKLKNIIIKETEVNQAISHCEKIQNEIINYKNVTDSCLKTCSQLTAEIIQLKKELEKYHVNNNNINIIQNTSGITNLNSSIGNTSLISNNYNSNINPRLNYNNTNKIYGSNIKKK